MSARRFPLILVLFAAALAAQPAYDTSAKYTKQEHLIPMRDGVKLFTSIYLPKDTSKTWPFMFLRTPYSVAPYGPDRMRNNLGPSSGMADEGYIWVYQDVRGRFRSEGKWVMMTPHKAEKKGPADVDESTDASDTIAWLLQNVAGHNGKAGMWGISYPGFYAAAGMIDAHPALAAVSPQAPATDMFVGDDFHHHGAFFLAHAFKWLSSNARSRAGPTEDRAPPFVYPTPDGYRFFLDLGPAAEADRKHLKGEVPAWREYMDHPHYDAYWQAQNLLPHLENIKPAVLNVGGWFDSEDLYGPLKVYKTVRARSPATKNRLVMGPWIHGGWARSDGARLGAISFGSATAARYRDEIEACFFRSMLKGEGTCQLPEAVIFETGSNRWREFPAWPPPAPAAKSATLWFRERGGLAFDPPPAPTDAGFDEYVSDPRRPVPFSAETRNTMGHEFMIEDQRFAWTRPDVLSYETGPLEKDVVIAGALRARLSVSTTGTDSDWIVKLIDVFPGDAPDPDPNPREIRLGHYQMLVRAEVMRGRYRSSYEKPEPMEPGRITEIAFELQDAAHCFKAGHRIMVQVQSTWFPLVDRNPQTYVDIYTAGEDSYRKATQRVFRSGPTGSRLEVTLAP